MNVARRAALAIAMLWLAVAAPRAGAQSPPVTITSPNGDVTVRVSLDDAGQPHYVVAHAGRDVLQPSRLGLVRDDADFSHGLRIVSVSAEQPVADDYDVLTAKRRHNRYRANRRVIHLRTASEAPVDLIFQVSNDGVAFRYLFPDSSSTEHELREELSSFHMLPGTRAWLQPMSAAKTGWGDSNPAYEEYYLQDVAAGGRAPSGAGWVYPALFRAGDTWLLISEAALARNYAGTRLRPDAPGGEYTIGFPDPRERMANGAVNPRSVLPWRTPWRLIVVGSLRTITESMLGVDLAEPPATPADSSIVPGKASWSWPLLGDSATTYDVQRLFIDYAADMG